jgi:hypothetical protein
LREVAFGHGADHPRHLGRRSNQIIDQPIYGFDIILPCSARFREGSAIRELPSLAHDLADSFEFFGQQSIHFNDAVQFIGDLSSYPCPIDRQPNRKISFLDRLEGLKHEFRVEVILKIIRANAIATTGWSGNIFRSHAPSPYTGDVKCRRVSSRRFLDRVHALTPLGKTRAA